MSTKHGQNFLVAENQRPRFVVIDQSMKYQHHNVSVKSSHSAQAMMNLILSFPWVLSANFHDGAVVASYPYDDYQVGWE